MKDLYKILCQGTEKLAVLIDPDKTNSEAQLNTLLKKIRVLNPTFLFVGGSSVDHGDLTQCIQRIKSHTDIPVIIFPGSHSQISEDADGLLFLSLLSGRNPDYLIGHQVESAHHLKKMDVETISTAYLLIDGGRPSSVSYVSQTNPIPADQVKIAVNTAIAGEMMGFSCVFMDAGSGAIDPVSPEMIAAVKAQINIPLIIGGGIKTTEDLHRCYKAGADLVVVGNKIEEDIDFLLDLTTYFQQQT